MAEHRGRLQVQGRDLPEPGYSWPWDQRWPPKARTGLWALWLLRERLTARQLARRDRAFEDAARWIRDVRDGNGPTGPTSRTFRNRGLPAEHRDARVDIEIAHGSAFTRDKL